ncbi:MAG: glycosyltransferase [Clostridiales bacterium]|nr:glycosyltransferase [Clostridiales bacterium]
MSAERKSIEIMIPLYHPDEKLDLLLERLERQTVLPEVVTLLLTVCGTDEQERQKEVEVIENRVNSYRKNPISIIWIPKEEFDHGATRDFGASQSTRDYVLFMTQDAVPSDSHLLECLLRPLLSDEKVAVSYARQLPGKKAGPVEQYTRLFNYPPESRKKTKDDLEEMGIKAFFSSDVCAMYRRETYIELGGFVKKTIFNEDMIYARKALDAGFSVYYAADAKVIHSHKYTYRQQFSRNFDLGVSQKMYEEAFLGISSQKEGIRLVKDTAKYLLEKKQPYLIPDLFLASGSKYLGYRLGKNYQKLPKWLIRRCTMSKGFWETK